MNNHESEIKMKEDKFREKIDEQDKLTTDKLKTQKEEMAADFQRRTCNLGNRIERKRIK